MCVLYNDGGSSVLANDLRVGRLSFCRLASCWPLLMPRPDTQKALPILKEGLLPSVGKTLQNAVTKYHPCNGRPRVTRSAGSPLRYVLNRMHYPRAVRSARGSIPECRPARSVRARTPARTVRVEPLFPSSDRLRVLQNLVSARPWPSAASPQASSALRMQRRRTNRFAVGRLRRRLWRLNGPTPGLGTSPRGTFWPDGWALTRVWRRDDAVSRTRDPGNPHPACRGRSIMHRV